MRFLVAFTAFAGGFITLSLEIMGFRVLAPHFGYSTYVFGSLIGLVLFALAVGYWIGGSISRRNVKRTTFFLVVLAGGIYTAVASAFYEPLLGVLEKYGVLAGSLLSTFVLWAFPMAVFAAISPYLVGIHAEKSHAGHSAGWISAVGTFGALCGTFLTSFYFLPTFGTSATFAGNAYAAIAVPLLWLLLIDRKWLLAVIALPVLATSLPQKSQLAANVIHAEESAYSRLEVVDYGKFLGLRTEGRSRSVYSIISKDGSLPPLSVYNLFAVPPAINDAKSGLLLGLGAGTLPHIHEILNPEFRLTGVEIDPKVVAIGKRFFRLDDPKNIAAVEIADARPFLAQDTERYDIIEMDVFRETEIPFYLASKEFFQITRSRLKENGLFVMNIFDPSEDRLIQKAVANTAAWVYPKIYVVPTGQGSFLLVAAESAVKAPEPETLSDPRLASLAAYFQKHVKEVVFSPQEMVFTDDRAPIEMLVAARQDLF